MSEYELRMTNIPDWDEICPRANLREFPVNEITFNPPKIPTDSLTFNNSPYTNIIELLGNNGVFSNNLLQCLPNNESLELFAKALNIKVSDLFKDIQ